MAQTIVGIFDNANEAQSAVQALIDNGFNRDDIDISNRSGETTEQTENRSTTDNYYTGDTTGGSGITDSVSNFFSSLFGGDDDSNSRNYSEVARRSSSIVTVHANSAEQAQTAAATLDQYNAIDVDERATAYSGTQTSEASTANTLTDNTTTATRADGDVSIPIVEEQLQVGKRTVEGGGARIRSRVFEKPVSTDVRLREERVFVDRQAVDRPATEADFQNFKEGEIELTERAEVPVVAKEARVVEEVSLGKDVTERTETISDTVRRTDVEVEEIEGLTDEQRRTANR